MTAENKMDSNLNAPSAHTKLFHLCWCLGQRQSFTVFSFFDEASRWERWVNNAVEFKVSSLED